MKTSLELFQNTCMKVMDLLDKNIPENPACRGHEKVKILMAVASIIIKENIEDEGQDLVVDALTKDLKNAMRFIRGDNK